MESPVLILVIGLVIGVLLTAKSPKEAAASLPAVAYHYILFGLFLFGATWALPGWGGFAAVLVAYGLYQIIGRRAGGIANVLSWFHLKRKPKGDPEIGTSTAALREHGRHAAPDPPTNPVEVGHVNDREGGDSHGQDPAHSG